MEKAVREFMDESRALIERYKDRPVLYKALTGDLRVMEEYMNEHPNGVDFDETPQNEAREAYKRIAKIEGVAANETVLSRSLAAALRCFENVQEKNGYLKAKENVPDVPYDPSRFGKSPQAFDPENMDSLLVGAKRAAELGIDRNTINTIARYRHEVKLMAEGNVNRMSDFTVTRDSDRHLSAAKTLLTYRDLTPTTEKLLRHVDTVDRYSYLYSGTTAREAYEAADSALRIEMDTGYDPDNSIGNQLRLAAMCIGFEREEKDCKKSNESIRLYIGNNKENYAVVSLDENIKGSDYCWPNTYAEKLQSKITPLSFPEEGRYVTCALHRAKIAALVAGADGVKPEELKAISAVERFHLQYPHTSERPREVMKKIEACSQDDRWGVGALLSDGFRSEYREALRADDRPPRRNAEVEPNVKDRLELFANDLRRYAVPQVTVSKLDEARLDCMITALETRDVKDEEMVVLAEVEVRFERDDRDEGIEDLHDRVCAMPEGRMKDALLRGMHEEYEVLRSDAERFEREVKALERDEKNFVNGFDPEEWAKKTGATREEDPAWGTGSHDPSELWTFPDGSVASVANPHQSAFPLHVSEYRDKDVSLNEKDRESLVDVLVKVANAREDRKFGFVGASWDAMSPPVKDNVRALLAVPREDRKQEAEMVIGRNPHVARTLKKELEELKANDLLNQDHGR